MKKSGKKAICVFFTFILTLGLLPISAAFALDEAEKQTEKYKNEQEDGSTVKPLTDESEIVLLVLEDGVADIKTKWDTDIILIQSGYSDTTIAPNTVHVRVVTAGETLVFRESVSGSTFRSWTDRYGGLVENVKCAIVYMPAMSAFTTDATGSVAGDYFFYDFCNSSIASLPSGSFDTSSITTVGDYFFYGFNCRGYLTSLPEDSFDTSNIMIVGDSFFENFNYGGSLVTLPAGSFDTSNITTIGNNFFKYFNFISDSLISLPTGSFDISNITDVGDGFFDGFNISGSLSTLPEGSFDTSSITSVGDGFFKNFNYGGSLSSLPVGSFDTSGITSVGDNFFGGFNSQGFLTKLPAGSFDTSNITAAGEAFFHAFNEGGSLDSLPPSFKLPLVISAGDYYCSRMFSDSSLSRGNEEIPLYFAKDAFSVFWYTDITPDSPIAGETVNVNGGYAEDISGASVLAIADQVFTGDEIRPVPSISFGTIALSAGIDYILTYNSNIDIGPASIIITGIGSYTGTKTVYFAIVAPPVIPPTITTSSLPGGTVGTSYSQTLTASGSTPIAWAISSGSLPAGLTLSSAGVISGTPTTAGSSTFAVTAANDAGNDTKSFTIVVASPVIPPTITTSSLPGGTVGTSYNQTLAASGSTPISWAISSGSLPAGLTLSSAGVISGTPTTAGSSSFTVRATNGAGDVTKSFTIVIAPATPSGSVSLTYSTHVQTVGWQTPVSEGEVSGTSGRALRLEGLKVNITNTTGYAGGIKYATHIQSIGWQAPVTVTTTGTSATEVKGGLSGTEGRALRLEAMTMELTGDLAKYYDIYYRVHAQSVGWMGWAKNGEMSGTAEHSLRLEAMQVCLVPKGSPAPPDSYKGVTTAAGTPRMIDPGIVSSGHGYTAVVHIQSIGDRTYSTANGSTLLGTSGQALRLEAMTLALRGAPLSGGISYETHIQSIGWQGAKTNGEMSGTAGRALRLEALRITLTGEMGKYYDVYYRTHIQSFGWTGWAKNGQSCGSAGYGYRMEAMQIVIVPKGGVAPGLNSGFFYQR